MRLSCSRVSLHNFIHTGRHLCIRRRGVFALEPVAHLYQLAQTIRETSEISYLSHCHPLYPFVLVDMFNDAFMHEKHVWTSRDIGMYRHRENEFVYNYQIVSAVAGKIRVDMGLQPRNAEYVSLTIFPVEVIEVISPYVLHVAVMSISITSRLHYLKSQ